MDAQDARDQMSTQFSLSRKQVRDHIAFHSGCGLGHIVFMEHQLSGQVRDQLKNDGYRLRRVRDYKIEVSWDSV